MLRKYLGLGSAAIMLATVQPALANEPLDPVKAVMEVTAKGKAEYFDPDSLMALYSVAFTRDLVAAVLKMKANDEQMFLGFEPVIGGQDNCPVKNVSYKAGPQKGNRLTVRVEFSAFYCMGNKAKSKVDFDLVQEGVGDPAPWYFVDDIRHIGEDGKTALSLRQQFKELAGN